MDRRRSGWPLAPAAPLPACTRRPTRLPRALVASALLATGAAACASDDDGVFLDEDRLAEGPRIGREGALPLPRPQPLPPGRDGGPAEPPRRPMDVGPSRPSDAGKGSPDGGAADARLGRDAGPGDARPGIDATRDGGAVACTVSIPRELMITDLSVVEDPARTRGAGGWTFRHLAEALAPSAAEAPALVEEWLSQWLSDQVVNGHIVPARPALRRLVLDPWPRLAGALDLSRAPLRLLAIVNRMDLRDLAGGNAGEGRFVFGVLDARGAPTEFTLILEYKLPAATAAEVRAWADAWHALGALPFPSEAYNAALEAITERFAGRGAAPGRPNGSALSQLRTNEIALASPWELREFALDAATGRLRGKPVELTPDASFDRSTALAGFVNANQAAILAGTHGVPNGLGGAPFAGGASLNDLAAWRAPGIVSNDARHFFSLNTCNGCHGAETGTAFLHVFPRPAGRPSALSAFLTGTALPDPVNPQVTRSFADLGRRSADLRSIVCAPSGAAPTAPASGVAPIVRALTTSAPGPEAAPSLTKGIGRVH